MSAAPPRKLGPMENAVGGAIGGMYAVCMSYPFDLIKTRQQFLVESNAAKSSVPNVVKTIWTEGHTTGLFGSRTLGGVAGFYRGLDQLLPEGCFKVMLRFLAFKELQDAYKINVLGDVKSTMTFGGNIACGAAAGFIEAAIVVQPFERGKTLRADFMSPYTVWGNTLKQKGFGAMLRSIYTGFAPCAGRQVGNQAASFSVFYGLKAKYLEYTGAPDLNTTQRLGFGFLGGCAGATFTMPMDVVKTIAQRQTGDTIKSTSQIVSSILKDKGVRGLYTGLPPRLARVGLDRAFGFLAFEYIVEKIGKWKDSEEIAEGVVPVVK